jgi:nicotinate-nucleotide adenylyltransferase
MTTVAIFGGSFNPPHVAHQMVCLYVLSTEAVDELWMVPTYKHPFNKVLAPYDDRFAMCELAAAALGPRVKVSDIERELQSETGRTLDTLRALHERHPATSFRLVVGTDILDEAHKWHRWDEIERLAPPIVVGRAGYGDPDVALPNVSSTEVRARVARGDSAVPLVSRAAMDYMSRRGLYR